MLQGSILETTDRLHMHVKRCRANCPQPGCSYQWRKPRKNLIIVHAREGDRVGDMDLLRMAMHGLSRDGCKSLWTMLCRAALIAERIEEVEIMFWRRCIIKFYLWADYCL
jgi:hypothetical protein